MLLQKATLFLNDDAIPKFCKLCILPFALKPVVGDELDCLKKQGVIKKVPHSDWATPIVVVRKTGGKVCTRRDFKINNQSSTKDQHNTYEVKHKPLEQLDKADGLSLLPLEFDTE